MRLRPATSPALPAEPVGVPRRLLALGVLGAVGFALVTAGVVRLPDLEGFLTDLSDTLGSLRRTMARWTEEDAPAEPIQPAPAPAPVARKPRPCPEPALLAA